MKPPFASSEWTAAKPPRAFVSSTWGTEELTSIEALVEFIDKDGNTVASYVISDTFAEPVEVGASFSETAECDSDSAIKGVYVTDYNPGS